MRLRKFSCALRVTTFALALLAAPRAFAAETVTVLYAGSLVGLMEQSLGPAFKRQTGTEFQGHAGGSKGLATQIKDGSLRGDVFISADPKVNSLLSGGKDGQVPWYITFAESPLVLGVSPSSRFADQAKGKPWNEVLTLPGAKIGRTDPDKDPKGAFTVEFLTKADKPQLAKSVLENSSVLPEEALVKKMKVGEIDVGFFYTVETTDAGLTAIDLPAGLTPKAIYTLTIPQNAPNPKGAEQFISFLLGSKGSALMKEHGLTLTRPALVGEDKSAPHAVRSLLGK
jgi:molybdate/tungstate transport system substrate-binding protein